METLENLKLEKWNQVKEIRSRFINGGISVGDIGIFDSDNASRIQLNCAATEAIIAQMTGESYGRPWTLADNSVIFLNGPDLLGVFQAMEKTITRIHNNARIIRTKINVANTEEELNNIDLLADWTE